MGCDLFEPGPHAIDAGPTGMVGGDAVALTVPEIRRRPGADSDLLPSDFSVMALRALARLSMHAFCLIGGVRASHCLKQKVDHEF